MNGDISIFGEIPCEYLTGKISIDINFFDAFRSFPICLQRNINDRNYILGPLMEKM